VKRSIARFSRRQFFKAGLGMLTAWVAPVTAMSALHPDHPSRTLAFFNTHTHERLSVCYYENRAYCPDALNRINYILRDHRTGDIVAIDRRLMDLLFDVKRQLAVDSPYHIISGYRSPKTNELLRRHTSGVAKRSYHMFGRAIDIRLPGCHTQRLKQRFIAMKFGGVGYYRKSDFIHVDTGDVRTWNG